MIPFCLSMTGVAFWVLEQSHVAIWGGVRVFGKAFCQTTLPLSASIANTVSSLPTTNTSVRRPCEVVTPSTTKGAVRVDNAISRGGTGS